MKYFSAAILLVVVTISVALGNTLSTGKPYPEFQIGVTGLNAAIKEGVFAITQITPDTPAEGRLKAGDVLLAVNGTSLEIQDPRHPLGEAINKADRIHGIRSVKPSIRPRVVTAGWSSRSAATAKKSM